MTVDDGGRELSFRGPEPDGHSETDRQAATDTAPDVEVSPDAAPEGEIPAMVLAVLRDRMHAHRLKRPDETGHIRTTVGHGDSMISVVDDGPNHCMIARLVGWSSDGCTYVLAGRVPVFAYEQMRDGDVEVVDAFADSRDISLCGVVESGGVVENLILVQHYRRPGAIPPQYLPPRPFVEFADPPSDEEEGST